MFHVKEKPEDTIVDINGEPIGTGTPTFVFGPCAVESYEQVAEVAASIQSKGLKLMRGGAYKPRTSPYDFQGLGLEGLKILKQISKEFGLGIVSEIVTPGHLDEALDYIDVIQIGARNMQNFELLKAVGSINKPVLLKRGIAATLMNLSMQQNTLCHKVMIKLFYVNVVSVRMKERLEIH